MSRSSGSDKLTIMAVKSGNRRRLYMFMRQFYQFEALKLAVPVGTLNWEFAIDTRS